MSRCSGLQDSKIHWELFLHEQEGTSCPDPQQIRMEPGQAPEYFGAVFVRVSLSVHPPPLLF